MKIIDLLLEVVLSSLPGNHDTGPMAFLPQISSALADVTEFLNCSIK